MNIGSIEYLAYLIKDAKEKNKPKPIVLLGAGASISAGIPDARTIAKMILERYPNNPKIQCLKEEEKVYRTLMGTLTSNQRNAFLKELIDKASINVTHIYLAQMMHFGYIDYFLTVNFDNLMQRALALFNKFPPTYDISILNDITTSSFHLHSITYLHGQHNGLWLLNTEEEMDKVERVIAPILNKITDGRTWIILGYSGDDPIFQHLLALGKFDSDLYWIGYKENLPSENVIKNLLNRPRKNAYLIQGQDADSFCLTLNNSLGIPEPIILNTPFTFLKNVQDNIVDIDDIEPYKNVKKRLTESKRLVDDAIKRYESEGQSEQQMSLIEINESLVKKEIINASVNKDFSQIDVLLEKAGRFQSEEMNLLLSDLYLSWGYDFCFKSNNLKGEEKRKSLESSLPKLEKATMLNPNNGLAYYNWGAALAALSDNVVGKEKKKYLEQCIDKFERAVDLESVQELAYYNWATALLNMAKESSGAEKRKYLELSFSKYDKSLQINKNQWNAYANWGHALSNFALTFKNGEQNQKIYLEQAIQKYEQSIELNQSEVVVYDNLASDLIRLSKLVPKGEQNPILTKALKTAEKTYSLGGSQYNIACIYAVLSKKERALEYLESSLSQNKIKKDHVLKDDDWKDLWDDEDFKKIIAKY